MRFKLLIASFLLLAVAWPGIAAPATKRKSALAAKPVAVKKRSSKKPVKGTARKKVVVRKAIAKKKRRPTAPLVASHPLNFATEPVKTELQACSLKEGNSGAGALCLNCAEQALSTAQAFTGLRYKRGGTDPDLGFDCSGFVRHVFVSSCGRELPRTAREQFEMGEPVEKAELKRGDLVFFSSRQGWHVGIYTGDNKFIHSPNRRESIRVSSLDTPYYQRMYKGARRLTTDIQPMLAAESTAVPTN